MNHDLEEPYLEWLYGLVASSRERAKSRTYWTLFKQLNTKEFVWLVPNDDNRIEDGKDLRLEFLHENGETDIDINWLEQGCSMLELLLSLSRHCAFESGGTAKHWFWHLIGNLQLEECTDASGYSESAVDEVLDRVIFRQYDYHGIGGLFPLRNPEQDQREVELWYQLNAYLIERF